MLSGFHPLLVFITLYADDIIKMEKNHFSCNHSYFISCHFKPGVQIQGKLFEISIKFLNEVSFTAILKEGLKLWCVSLNEQSVGCVDVLGQCVHCIQWTSVSHRATAAEMTHVSQTDFMPLHKIVVQGMSRFLQIPT